MILKQVVHYPDTNSVEAAWVDRSIAPDTLDADGATLPGAVTEVQVKYHSYADVQMDMFRADVLALGGNIAEHEAMIAVVEAAIVPYVAPPDPPITVSPRQIRQALTAAGLRASVEAAIAAGDQDTRDWWEFATVFEENHPLVAGMGTALGVSAAQLHDVFVLAASL